MLGLAYVDQPRRLQFVTTKGVDNTKHNVFVIGKGNFLLHTRYFFTFEHPCA